MKYTNSFDKLKLKSIHYTAALALYNELSGTNFEKYHQIPESKDKKEILSHAIIVVNSILEMQATMIIQTISETLSETLNPSI